jgi:hypothetical protein
MLQHLLNWFIRDGRIIVRAPDGRIFGANGAREADCRLMVRIGANKTLRRIMAKDRAAVPLTRDYITDFDRSEPLAHRIAAE